MPNTQLKLAADYWLNFVVTKQDIDFLQNYLFETETPLAEHDLTHVLVEERIRAEYESLTKKKKGDGEVFLPKETYKKDQKLVFPALNWRKGKILSVRPGNNPQIGAFDVLEVSLEDNSVRLFAAGLADHKLNNPIEEAPGPDSDPQVVIEEYGQELAKKLESALLADENLIRSAGQWFPRALIVDMNEGHLNLAEAVIEMAGGEPLSISSLMEQIDAPQGVSAQLVEFSLNYALQEDGRFDEVGPAGQVLWCLKRLEPEEVQKIPPVLKYNPVDYDRAALSEEMLALEYELDDEFSESEQSPEKADKVKITLTYPHWRAGTLPVSPRVRHFFPTAYESPRVRFILVDANDKEEIPAWVVREHGYVFGLKAWFDKNKLIPGAQVIIRRSKTAGKVIIEARTRKSSKDWVRTVLAGSDGGVVFALLRQEVACDYDDRMVTVVPDVDSIDQAVAQIAKSRSSLEKIIKNVLHELSKLTPQGHVHAEELYSAVNILRRIPPGPLMALLASSTDFNHIGDLYFRLAETEQDEG
jgi:hypothetical protein